MRSKLSRVATSEEDEFLLLLEEATSPEIHGWWYVPRQIEDMAVRGAFCRTKLPKGLITRALMTATKYSRSGWGKDRYRSKNYYCIQLVQREYDAAKDQHLIIAESEENLQLSHWSTYPTIRDDHFRTIELNYLEKYLRDLPTGMDPPRVGDRDTRDDGVTPMIPPVALDGVLLRGRVNIPKGPAFITPARTNPAANLFCGTCGGGGATPPAPTTLAPPPPTTLEKKSNSNRCPLSIKHDGPIGYYIATIGNNASVGKIFHEHSMECPGKC
jgi:hypothetical protein